MAMRTPRLPHPLGPGREAARLRLRTLTLMRWIALIGQAIALCVVYFGLGLEIPFVAAMAVVLIAGAINVAVSFLRPSTSWLKPAEAAGLLAFDLIQLSVLLWLTGGLENPFALLVLAPITAAAWALSPRLTAGLAALAIALVSLLALWSQPLPWPDSSGGLPPYYLAGVWAALVVAICFIAAYVSSTSREAAGLSQALNAAQLALSREQQLSALGGLAAAAAHELGSPLATLAVVARELERELPGDSPFREDARLLRQETERCRQILAELAQRPEQDGGEPYNRIPLRALVEAAAAPHRRPGKELVIVAADDDASAPMPMVWRDAEILHGLGAVIENALDFAAQRVEFVIEWQPPAVELRVEDDGPGFDLTLLSQLGEPYFTTRARSRNAEAAGAHMGLGLFIARTLLARSGAEVAFANRRGSPGAVVTIRWPEGIVAANANPDEGP